ncbi:FAD-dependent monooxygenase [Amycolatopsis sp. NPDC003676]
MEPDVVVVGGGPAGLMLASELRLAGVGTAVLEHLPEPAGPGGAGGLHPRSIELFDQRGMLQPLLAAATAKLPGSHFAALASLDYGVLATRHAYFLTIPPAQVVRILENRAVESGAEVRHGHRLVGLAQDADGVSLDVAGPAGRYVQRAAYVVGCDRSGSAVRELAGAEFPGAEPTAGLLMGEVELGCPPETVASGLPTPIPAGEDRTVGVRALPWLEHGVYRVTIADFSRPFADRTAPVDLEEFRAALAAAAGQDYGVRSARWLARFDNARRQASEYRLGRVFLAGDAAHVHWPAGEQALGLGLGDAVNLGWKLAAQVNGWAPSRLLDSYHDERHPVGAQVLADAEAQAALMHPRRSHAPLRALVARLAALPDANASLAETASGLGIRYEVGGPAHPWTGLRAPDFELASTGSGATIGELLRTGRGLLLDFTGRQAAAEVGDRWRARIEVVSAPPSPRRPVVAVAVRPDGHVVWAADGSVGEPAAGLAHALTTWFGTTGD